MLIGIALMLIHFHDESVPKANSKNRMYLKLKEAEKRLLNQKLNKWSLKWFLFNGVREGALVIYWLSYNGMYRNFSASFSFFLFSKHEQQLFWVVKANDPCIPGIFICGIRGGGCLDYLASRNGFDSLKTLSQQSKT